MRTETVKIPRISCYPFVSMDGKYIYLEGGTKLVVFDLEQHTALQEIRMTREGTCSLSHNGELFFWVDGSGKNAKRVTFRLFRVTPLLEQLYTITIPEDGPFWPDISCFSYDDRYIYLFSYRGKVWRIECATRILTCLLDLTTGDPLGGRSGISGANDSASGLLVTAFTTGSNRVYQFDEQGKLLTHRLITDADGKRCTHAHAIWKSDSEYWLYYLAHDDQKLPLAQVSRHQAGGTGPLEVDPAMTMGRLEWYRFISSYDTEYIAMTGKNERDLAEDRRGMKLWRCADHALIAEAYPELEGFDFSFEPVGHKLYGNSKGRLYCWLDENNSYE